MIKLQVYTPYRGWENKGKLKKSMQEVIDFWTVNIRKSNTICTGFRIKNMDTDDIIYQDLGGIQYGES